MKDQRFYIVTSVGKKLAIINETAAQFTVKGCPQWARPQDVAEAVCSSPGFFELGVGVMSAGELNRSKHGRAALRRWGQRDDSTWRAKARAQSLRDVGLNLGQRVAAFIAQPFQHRAPRGNSRRTGQVLAEARLRTTRRVLQRDQRTNRPTDLRPLPAFENLPMMHTLEILCTPVESQEGQLAEIDQHPRGRLDGFDRGVEHGHGRYVALTVQLGRDEIGSSIVEDAERRGRRRGHDPAGRPRTVAPR